VWTFIIYTLFKILKKSTSYKKSMRMRWTGHLARMQEKRNAYRFLAGKPAGKRPLGRPSNIWENNIGMDLGEKEWDDMDGRSIRKEETEKGGKKKHNVGRKNMYPARLMFYVVK
jgi:hypothetical protein